MAERKPGQHRLEANNPKRVDSQRGASIQYRDVRRKKKKKRT